MSAARERFAQPSAEGAGRGDDHAKMPLAGLYLVTGDRRLAAFYGDIRGAELWEDKQELECLWYRTRRLECGAWAEATQGILVRNPDIHELRKVLNFMAQAKVVHLTDGEGGFSVEVIDAAVS